VASIAQEFDVLDVRRDFDRQRRLRIGLGEAAGARKVDYSMVRRSALCEVGRGGCDQSALRARARDLGIQRSKDLDGQR
jgi:hypothetical protein